jgi:quercetin dioxygenase-like cupin family protein
MENKGQVILQAPGEGRCVGWQGGVLVYKVLSDETDDRYTLNGGTVTPWSGPQPRILTREDQGCFVLTGELTFTAGNQTITVPERGFLNVSRGTAHTFVNRSDVPAEVLVLNAPGGFDRFQFEAGYPLADCSDMVPAAGPTDIARMKAAAPKYGIDLSPPAEAFQKPPVIRLTKPGEGKAIDVIGDRYRFLAQGEDTGGSYALWEAVVPPGSGPPLHVHSREQEGFYVVDGEMTFQIEDQMILAPAGTFAHLPTGVRHAFRNTSDQPVRMLILVAPAGLEKMFFETGVPVTDLLAPFRPPSAEEVERLVAAVSRYGIELFL